MAQDSPCLQTLVVDVGLTEAHLLGRRAVADVPAIRAVRPDVVVEELESYEPPMPSWNDLNGVSMYNNVLFFC